MGISPYLADTGQVSATTLDDQLPPPGEMRVGREFLKRWVDDSIYYAHAIRTQDFSNMRRAEEYDQNHQWLWRAAARFDSGAMASQWVQARYDPSDPNYIPMPVFNEGLGARQNETARLAAPNYRPVVHARTKGADLKAKLSAKTTTDMARHRMKEMGWPSEAWKLSYHMPLYGGAWIRSEWRETWASTIMVPVQTAAMCQNCKMVLASPPPGGACLSCGGPMEPRQITPEEAGKKDSAGQPLGESQMLGDWWMRVLSPYNVFVGNLGFNMNPDNIHDWAEAHVESLDWVAERWPELAGKVRPENPGALAAFHPVAGAPNVLPSLLDARIFRKHVRIRERHRAPWMEGKRSRDGKVFYEWNRGRSVIWAGDELLHNGEFLMPSLNYPGEYIPRVHLDYIIWEFRDGAQRLQGMGLWDVLFDPQDTRNAVASQTQAVRERCAVPTYAFPEGADLQVLSRAGVPGRGLQFRGNPEAQNYGAPVLFNNTTIDPGVHEETEDAINFIQRAAHRAEVEQGRVQPGVSAAATVRLLKGSASEIRQPRVDRMKEAMERCVTHGVQLMAHVYSTPRAYRHTGEDGQERWAAVLGTDLVREFDVDIDVEPSFDEKLKDMETVREMVQGRVLEEEMASSGTLKRRIMKILEAPKDLIEQGTLQEEAAQREWSAFIDGGKFPRVDPGLDGHRDHHEEHGIRAHSERFRALEEQGGWDEALKILGAQWPVLKILAMQPEIMDPALAQMDIQDRVVAFWGTTLLKVGFQPPNPQALQAVLQWRAHMEAHKLLEEMAQMAALAAPVVAQPGAEATASGTQPTPGQAPAERGAPAQ